MTDDDIVGTLDNSWDGTKSGRHGLVALGKESVVTADQIVGWRSVDGLLDVATVEVIIRSPAQRRKA